MKRKFIYSGIILFFIAALIFYITAYSFKGLIYGNGSLVNSTIASNNYNVIAIRYSSPSPLLLHIIATSPVNIYVLTGKLYSLWQYSATLNGSESRLQQAEALSPIVIWKNNTYVRNSGNYSDGDVFPNTDNASGELYFNLFNKSQNSADDSLMYLVIDNTKGSVSSGTSVKVSGVYLFYNPSLPLYGIIVIICFIVALAALAVFTYGMISSPRPPNSSKPGNATAQTPKHPGRAKAITHEGNGSVSEIKELEDRASKNPRDKDSLDRLRKCFANLSDTEDGPLEYIDITTTGEIKNLYKIDTGEYFDALDKKTEDMGGGNPNNYAILANNFKLVVIERTPRNESISKDIVNQIISALDKIS